MSLEGRVAIITGSSRGIGADMARYLARAGVAVVVAARSETEPDPRLPGTIHSVVAEIEEAGGRALAVRTNARELDDLDALVERTMEEFGRIDILINNAALSGGGGLNRLKRNHLELFWEVDLRAPIILCQLVIPHMREAGGGLIVNISSLAGIAIHPLAGVAYTASKHGMTALSHHVNEEQWRHGIRACAICPGEVDTPILDARSVELTPEERARMSRPEDVAAAVRMVALMPPRTTIGQLTIFPTRRRTLKPGEVP